MNSIDYSASDDILLRDELEEWGGGNLGQWGSLGHY